MYLFIFCQINGHILYTQGYVNLLQQRYQLWYSGYNKDYYWVEFTIVHYLSSRSVWFCRGHSCELNGNRMRITISIYFGYLFIIFILKENNIIFKILFRPVDGTVQYLPLYYSCDPQGKETVQELYQLPSISIQMIHSGNGAMIIMGCHLVDPLCTRSRPGLCVYLIPTCLHLYKRATITHQKFRYKCQKLCTTVPTVLCYYFFPWCVTK